MEIQIPPSRDFVPEWLQTAVNYYKTTGKNFRYELFKHVAITQLEEESIKTVGVVLNLFQLSILMLDDIFDKSTTRRSEKCMHLEHGTTLVSTWAIGITHHIYQLTEEHFEDKELAAKFNKLYNEIGIRTLRGQCLELTVKDYPDIVKYKTSYYTVCFPVAICMLMKTRSLEKAMDILEDPDLLRMGFLFQSENDFLGAFEPDNTDIEMKSWTILIDMMAKKDSTFKYPVSRQEANALYEKHDVYNEYVQMRERELQQLRVEAGRLKMCYLNMTGGGKPGLGRDPDVLACKYLALEYCLGFFETYKYQGPIPGEAKEPAAAASQQPATAGAAVNLVT